MKGRKIGFLGLGIMGGAMARNLLKSGCELYVFNRSAERTQELAKAGAHVCPTPAAVAAEADTILMCLTNAEAVESVLFGGDGVSSQPAGVRRVIDHSTIAPSQAKSISERLRPTGIAFLDAPVSGGDVGAREGTLTIMVGGERDELEASREILSWLGRKIVYMGPSGSGQLTKCVNQLVVAGTVAAMTEGLVFAQRAGLDVAQTIDVIGSGAAGSWSLANYAPRILKGDLKPGFYARDMLKDLRIVLREADGNQTPLPVLSLVKELYHALCAGGDGDLGNHGLIRLYERLAEPK